MASSQSFRWGVHDCVLFVCDCIRLQTGIDPVQDLRGQYSDEHEAQVLLAGSLGDFFARRAELHGLREWPSAKFARRGDPVFLGMPGIPEAMGVVSLDGRFAFSLLKQGLTHVPMARWKRAWNLSEA